MVHINKLGLTQYLWFHACLHGMVCITKQFKLVSCKDLDSKPWCCNFFFSYPTCIKPNKAHYLVLSGVQYCPLHCTASWRLRTTGFRPTLRTYLKDYHFYYLLLHNLIWILPRRGWIPIEFWLHSKSLCHVISGSCSLLPSPVACSFEEDLYSML